MKLSTLASIIAFSIISTSMVQASTQENIIEASSNVSAKITYENMTTSQLQVAVENHSMMGSLSFELGHELMERWTSNNVSAKLTYENMTTTQLQKAVEHHSTKGSLSFALGHELMKRWANS